MKSHFKYLSIILVFFICCLANQDVMAQRKTKKKSSKKSSADKYFDDKGGSLKSKIYYAGSINFNLNSTYFAIGGKPMVGYKITDNFSGGAIVDIAYTTFKSGSVNSPRTLNTFLIGPGVFSRYKFLNMFFGHVETTYLIRNATDKYVDSGGVERKEKFSESDLAPKVGLGYYAGSGGIGMEISVLYDFYINENYPNQIPLEYRIGINYNF